jgi:hypothetical protein
MSRIVTLVFRERLQKQTEFSIATGVWRSISCKVEVEGPRHALVRDGCLVPGFQFQAIDLRWGVPREASLDHRSMEVCFHELRQEQEVSPKPNFLVLLGDRRQVEPVVRVVQFRAPLKNLSDCDAAPYLRFFLVRNEEVVGSNPISSTKMSRPRKRPTPYFEMRPSIFIFSSLSFHLYLFIFIFIDSNHR